MAAKSKIDTVAIQEEINEMEFTCTHYIRSVKHTLGCAVSRLSDVYGAAAHICRAITEIEKVEGVIVRRINSLKAKLPKEGK